MRRTLCTLLLALFAGPSCQRSVEGYFGTVRPRHPPDTLWINNTTEPEWIDPGKCADGVGGSIIDSLFAGLMQANPRDTHPEPDVAESWTLSPDAKTYVFTLRPSQWSDGHPLTAEDFAWSWRRVLDPNTASRYASMLYILRNGQAFAERALWVTTPTPIKAADLQPWLAAQKIEIEKIDESHDPNGLMVFLGGAEAQRPALAERALKLAGQVVAGQPLSMRLASADLVGVRALDDRTLEVRLNHPVPYFLSLAAYHVFRPVPRHVVDRLAADHQNTDLWTRPENIVSNGPYVLGEWHFKHYLTYEKNPRYWDAEHVQIQHVRVLEVDNVNTALNMYRTGDLDWLGNSTPLPSEFIAHMQQYKDTHIDPMLSVYFYWLNTHAPPLDNVKVRRALSLAIDREALVKYVTRGGQLPTADLVPDKLGGYAGLKQELFNPAKAKQLLTEAGYPNGAGLPPVTLTYNTAEGHKQLAEAVQEMWHKTLNIEVQIENQEWKVYLGNLDSRSFQVARMAWAGDYADANTFLSDVLSQHAGNNLSGWHDARYEKLLDEGNNSPDPAQRLALLRQAEALAMEAQPLIPIYVYTRSYTIKPYIKGFWPDPLDHHGIKHMSIDSRWYDGVPTGGT